MAYYNIPDFDPRIVGWIITYSKINYWKVKDFMDLEDLIHEGFDCLLYAFKKYPDRVAEPKKFMNTVKLMVSNNIPYLQNRNVRMPEGRLIRIGDICDAEHEIAFMEMLLGADEEAQMREVVANAPSRIRPVLEAFLDETSGLHAIFKRRGIRMDGYRESLNEKFCRFLGIDSADNDISSEVRSYLGG